MANEFIARNGIIAKSDSVISGSLSVTNSINGSFTGSFSGSGIITSASFASTALTASYVATASYIPTLDQITTAGNTTTNTISTGPIIATSVSTPSKFIGDNVLYQNTNGAPGTGYAIEFGTNSVTPRIDFVVNNTYTGQFSAAGNNVTFKNNLNNLGQISFNTKNSNVESTRMLIFNNGNIGIGTTTDSGRLTIKGSGTTSATNALRVENANASASLQVRDDGSVLANSISVPDTSGNYISALGPYDNNEIEFRGTHWRAGGVDIGLGNGSMFIGGNMLHTFGISLGNNNTSMQPGRFGTIIRYTGNSSLLNNSTTFALKAEANINITDGTTTSGSVVGVLIEPVLGTLNNVNYIALRSTTGNVQLNTIDGSTLIGTTVTSSFKLDVSGSGRFTDGLTVTGSTSISGLTSVYKSGSTVLDIQGSQGQLFSVVDSLTGSLMSVNDISGLPILEVFSDDRVVMGTYGAPGLVVSGSSFYGTGSIQGTITSASFANTASYVNPLTQSVLVSGSVTASVGMQIKGIDYSAGSSAFGADIKIGKNLSPFATNGNIALGDGVLRSLNTSNTTYNVAVGYQALSSSTNGFENIAIGYQAMALNTLGSYNVAIGTDSLRNSGPSADWNVGIGYQALQYTNGNDNVGIGEQALRYNEEGSQNVGIGFVALSLLYTGSLNTGIGNYAGGNIESGSQNIFIGHQGNVSGTPGPISSGSNNTIIGGNFKLGAFGSNSVSNTVVLADGSGSIRLYSPASTNVLIGTLTDTGEKFQVSGSAKIAGDVNINGTLTATVKSFLIDHPTQPGKKLQYGNLEGPEHAVYFRGRSTAGSIKLPEEWVGLVDESTITVQLTPIGTHQQLYVEDIKENTVYVNSSNWISKTLNYFYLIHAERKDVGKLKTVI